MNKIISILRKIVLNYDKRHELIPKTKNIYMCNSPDTRNRYKNDKYKIPFDKPQCPIFNDNRCCGGCNLVSECDHAVDCNCFGFVYSAMGGTDKKNYMKKCTQYYGLGKISSNGKFDWDYYKLNKFKHDAKSKKFFELKIDNKKYVAEITTKIKRDGSFKCFIKELGYYKNIKFEDLEDFLNLYNTYETVARWIHN